MATTYSVGLDFQVKADALDQLTRKLNAVDAAAAKVGNGANNIRKFGSAGQVAAGGFNSAAIGAQGLGAALTAALGPLAAVTSAAALVGKALNTAFERSAAEQKLRNFTSSTGEYEAALGLAARATQQFGISQTEATAALGDTYGRLKGLGFGLKETGEIYTGFNAIALQSGTTAEDAAGAFLQLSQALGSGKLQGDELRAILERMPQLAQAISASMGVSAGEIRKMGQEGKITSEVIYKALSDAAKGADGLGTKLNAQQQAMKNLGQVADKLFNQIGQVFAPVVVKGAEMLAYAGEKIAEWWDYLGKVIFPKVQEALKPLIEAWKNAFDLQSLESIGAFLQNVMIKALEFMVFNVGNLAKVMAVVINAFKALSENPVFQFIADNVARVVSLLGLGGSKVQEFKAQQDKVTEAAAASADQYSSLPEKLDDAKEKAKELKAAQDAVTKSMQVAVKAADDLAAKQSAQLQGQLSVAEARLAAEAAINDVYLQQAERQLQAAVTQEERIVAAQQVYDLTVRQAELERAQTQASIAAATQQAALAVQQAQIKERELAAVVSLAQAQGVVTQAHYDALEAQRQALGLAEIHLETAGKMAAEQLRAADAIYKGKVAAADAQLATNLMSQNIASSAQGAAQLAANLGQAANAAARISGGGGGGGSGGQYGGYGTGRLFGVDFGNAGKDPAFAAGITSAIDDLRNVYGNRPGQFQSGYYSIINEYLAKAQEMNKPKRYATGGYVTGPQSAMIGEGGESEYIIPASKMESAMASYASGKRGSDVVGSGTPQVNIRTGPVTQMDGQRYLTLGDAQKIAADATQQTLGLIRRDPSVRRSLGVAR